MAAGDDRHAHSFARDNSEHVAEARLRRLAALEAALPALFETPDAGAALAVLWRVAGDVVPAEALSLTVRSPEGVTTIVQPATAAAPPDPPSAPGDDVELVTADGRSRLRVPIRIDDRIEGTLTFASRATEPYAPADAALARRMGGYLSHALGFQRLAAASRAGAAFQERVAALDRIDEEIRATVAGVLDVREVMDRIYEVSQRVIVHDAMTIAVATGGIRIAIYATTGALRVHLPIRLEIDMPDPTLLERQWDFDLIPDLLTDLRYRTIPSARAGMRCLLIVPVRLEEQVRGWVNFFSKTPRALTLDDVPAARRIAANIVLALSHHRLAQEQHQRAELVSRTANLELLDELLGAVSADGDFARTFERIFTLTRKVLPHDLLVLPVALPDGRHVHRYVAGEGDLGRIADLVDVPDELQDPAWEHTIADDISVARGAAVEEMARLGFKSGLGVAVRLEGGVVAGLGFLSRSPAAFKKEDVAIARRVANRVALGLSRERSVEAARRADEATERALRLEARVRALTDELDARTGYRRVVGNSATWRKALTQATQVAATETTVLLLGESGTGKEVIARFLHRASKRRDGAFVALNCAALPEHLLEAELFGYERGAFTGAMQSKPGQLEQASGGTLFLDEVGEMSPSAQAKFLRVLQEREFQRLGGTRVLRTDARVVAATNRDLQKAMSQGTFREDLFYRLNVFAIKLPPLRDRREDVLALSEAFLTELGKTLGRPPSGISRDARQMLLDYHWPGNVRELRNILERAAILCDGGLISAEHLAITPLAPVRQAATAPAAEAQPAGTARPLPDPPSADADDGDDEAEPEERNESIRAVERTMIERALQKARFNKSQAAKDLGLSRRQLYIRMRRYGLE
jgi:transcriptional regulator with GAF, ATPase, and Fis domain